jgi:hypothetical protein
LRLVLRRTGRLASPPAPLPLAGGGAAAGCGGRTLAAGLAGCDGLRGSLGGPDGLGSWKILQDFFANPGDVNGTASKLESAAAKAFK